MKIVALDKAHVDYFQQARTSRRGLASFFGIRVMEGCFSMVVKIGDGSPYTCGKAYPIQTELNTLPSHLRMIVDDYLFNYPRSDLVEVLAGEKSFQDALNCPAESEAQRTTATGRVRLAHSS
jgi:hypothetical protein